MGLISVVPVSQLLATPPFCSYVAGIEDEWTDEEEWEHNMRRMAQGSKQEDSEDDVESSDEI